MSIGPFAAAVLIAASPAPHPVHGGYGVHVTQANGATHSSVSNQATSASPVHVLNTACAGDGGCLPISCPRGAVPVWHEVLNQKGEDVQPGHMACLGGGGMPQLTPGMIRQAFRRIPVPTPALHIQPVKGKTLVNFRTNFYATGGETFTRTITLLGQRVSLRIHVDHYDFHFGDGHDLVSADPGAAYPRLTDTHEYLRKGTVHPYLATTWAADYRLGSGPWHTVGGTVTRTGAPQRLQVLTATPLLTTPTY